MPYYEMKLLKVPQMYVHPCVVCQCVMVSHVAIVYHVSYVMSHVYHVIPKLSRMPTPRGALDALPMAVGLWATLLIGTRMCDGS